VIVPAIPTDFDFRSLAKHPIELRTPEGRVLQTHIGSVELPKRKDPPGQMMIMLPPDIAKQDVPIGTEV
jgi:hypothetical protein